MEENIKTRVILILAVLSGLLFVVTVNSCSNSYRQKAARDKEMASRLDLEEKMSKFSQEKAALEEKLRVKDRELAEEKVAHEATKKALLEEQLMSSSLKEGLQKVSKLKDILEENLKEALVSGKSVKSKK